MLAELDVVVFVKSPDDLDRTAERIFGALKSEYQADSSEDWGGNYYQASGLGFNAALFSHTGDMLDPEFEDYQYGLEITSEFWCVELDESILAGQLSEYYARLLAFDLNVETATEVLLETTEEAEIFEIRAFRRNPQYRLDQAPTTPKVFLIETRQVEEPFDEDDWEEEEYGEAEENEETEEVAREEP